MKKMFHKYFYPFIFIGVIPLIFSGVVLYFFINKHIGEMEKKITEQSGKALKTAIAGKNESIADGIGYKVEKPIHEILHKIIAMSQSPVFRNMDLQNIAIYCDTVLYSNPSILEISVVDAQGRERFRNSRSLAVLEKDYCNISRQSVFEFVKKGRIYFSDVEISEIANFPHVVIGQPIERYRGKCIGGIIVSIELSFIWDMVIKEETAKKGLVYIISDKGLLLSHPSKKEIYENPQYDQYEYIQKILNLKSGSIIEKNSLLSFATNDYSWTTIIEVPLKDTLRSVEENKNIIYRYIQTSFWKIMKVGWWIIFIVISVSALMGIIVTRKILNPIFALQAATRRIAQGDFITKIDIVKHDEIWDLAVSFNKMTEDIREITVSRNELADEVAERKKAEEALKNAYEKLKGTQEQLIQSEKMASVGQLAAGVAHEINNPTGFVMSNLSVLKTYMTDIRKVLDQYEHMEDLLAEQLSSATETPLKALQALKNEIDLEYILEDATKLIEESYDGTKRIKRIVADLKSFSHSDEGRQKPADLNELMDSALNIAWNELKYKTDIVKHYLELPPILCYPQLLSQVFLNVLINAAHAIETRGTITIKTYAKDKGVFVEISDTGRGMPQEVMTKIFDPFFTTKPVGKGTWLGLSLAFNIMQKHNGGINVESEVGKGTTFTIRLPVSGVNRSE